MSAKNIICFGEILWDLFPTGKMLGGAPFNVANTLFSLGGKVSFISRVGKDELGNAILTQVENQGLSSAFIQQDHLH